MSDIVERLRASADPHEIGRMTAQVMEDAADEIERLRNPDAEMPWEPSHRHYRGGLYRVVNRGWLETAFMPAIIYEAQDGSWWVRTEDDFNAIVFTDDGERRRFEPLPSPPTPTQGG